MHRFSLATLAVSVILTGGACASPVSAVYVAESAGSTEAADLSWLSGHWRRGGGENVHEEIWTDGAGGLMLAVSRTVRDGEAVMFEFMHIQLGDDIVFTAYPRGAPGTAFTVVEQGETRIVFANPDNDYPTHVEYARDGAALTAQIWGADGRGAGPSWRWERVSD